MYPSNNPTKPQLSTATLILAIVLVLELMGVVAVRQRSNSLDQPTKAAVSQSTVSPKRSNQPVFKNFGALTDQGLTDDQLTGLKYSFTLFTRSLTGSVKEVTLDTSSLSVSPRDPNNPDPNNKLVFQANLDNGDHYYATLAYSGLSTIHLTVAKDSASAPLFDAGEVDINTGTPVN